MTIKFLSQSIQSLVRLTNGETSKSIQVHNKCIAGSRFIHTTPKRLALEEFFDHPDNYGASKVTTGRAWRIDELRLKSNSDLHKLWFVLYKERNMLYTMQYEAKKENQIFPSPERIDKVETSMANLENVVRERNKAYWQLEVSPCATGERPTVYRRDVLGRWGWKQCSQHLVPFSRNRIFKEQNLPGKFSDYEHYFNKYREMKRKNYNYDRANTARYIRNIFRRFPNADAGYIAELHPEFPQGYVQHLKDNLDLYDDPPATLTKTRLISIDPAEDHQNIDSRTRIK